MPNTIPVATAQTWVDRWRASDQTLTDIKGFLIPGEDLSSILAESGAVDSRAYLAIDDENQFHLLLVGVDSNGDDMIDEDEGLFIYDFTHPCPPMCSKTGPLK